MSRLRPIPSQFWLPLTLSTAPSCGAKPVADWQLLAFVSAYSVLSRARSYIVQVNHCDLYMRLPRIPLAGGRAPIELSRMSCTCSLSISTDCIPAARVRTVSTTDSKSPRSCMTSLVMQVCLSATADPRVTSIEESFSSKSIYMRFETIRAVP
ncbi:hypothetical protein FKP32DRAFT_458035 [Trametes sanguinea]|nr:hypothetical protein FKP32DRAFT_458035 [Trametes sanguinea]